MKNLRLMIRERMEELTLGERKIANVIFADYPFGALGTLQDLAQKAGVSVPSVTRFVAKFGFEGFKDFQRLLVEELQERQSSPRDLASNKMAFRITSHNAAKDASSKQDSPKDALVQNEDFFSSYIGQLASAMDEMATNVPSWQFDKFVDLLKDPSRHIFLIGGRISDKIADFMGINLRQIRGNVFHMSNNPEIWPEYVLRMRRKDVVLFFDFRRYQQSLAQLAATIAQMAQPHMLLVTDRWMSPIARYSKQVIALPTQTQYPWDTMISVCVFVEALIVKIMEDDWDGAQKRIEKWDMIRGVASLMDKNKGREKS